MTITLAALHLEPSPQALPLGPAFLKSALLLDEELAARTEVEIVDLFLSDDDNQCLQKLLAPSPVAIGFSVFAWNRLKTLGLAARLRREFPGVLLFAGGPEASADPEGMLADGALDLIVVGEGELPFIELAARLAEGKPVEGIPGTVTRESGQMSPHPPQLLDSIPSPYLSGVLDLSRYGGGALWQLSRGCDFGCAFCYEATEGGGVRRFSLERVEAELRHFVAVRVSQVFVLDATFNRDPKRAKQILKLIETVAPHIHFHFEARSEFIDEEQAELFSRITCSLQIGLQSADPKVLKNVSRSLDPKAFSAKIGLLNRSGAIFGFDLIFGLPGDSPERFEKSLDFALSLYPNHLDIFPLAILPGTTLATRCGEFGIRHLEQPPYTILSSPGFSAQNLERCRRLAAACDIFYSRGKAVAWFNGVVAALGLKPSQFLGLFADRLDELNAPLDEKLLDDDRIYEFQRDFLETVFTRRGKTKLLPLAQDLALYHRHYAAALLTPEPELPTDRDIERLDMKRARFRLNPSARLARFNYEIYDILEAGEVELADFVRCFKRTGSFAVIYPRAGEVFTESLIEPWHRLLERLDGATPLPPLLKGLRVSFEEATEFMEFAVAEGIAAIA